METNGEVSFSAINRATGEKRFYIDAQEAGDHDMEYFVGLHELGHLALNHRGRARVGLSAAFVEEASAWKWALSHSRRRPSNKVYENILSTFFEHLEAVQINNDFWSQFVVSNERNFTADRTAAHRK
jgi:hypothetical protein